jgi:hypothetical protein
MPTKFVNFEHTKCAVLFIINTNRLCQPGHLPESPKYSLSRPQSFPSFLTRRSFDTSQSSASISRFGESPPITLILV